MKQSEYTKFIDETGDMSFFERGGGSALGKEGVSRTFAIGMVKMKAPLEVTREEILDLCKQVEQDRYLNAIPSVKKKINSGGFYFHAKDDTPEVREKFFKYLDQLGFSLQIIVARKRLDIFIKKHNSNENEFYADILGHLLKDKMTKYSRLVLNIAQRGSATSSINLDLAKNKALGRFRKNNPDKESRCRVVFNVQDFKKEPILSVADYASWAVQRVFERGDTRHYDYIQGKVSSIVDLYDYKNFANWGNYYSPKKPLTKDNKIEIDPLPS